MTQHNKPKVVEKQFLLPFIIITSLFALWGFANDITNPMVAAFKDVMQISTFKASFVQAAFYGGYGTMAIPAALFVQKYSYKAGILLGLALYAIGALLFWPAAHTQQFGFFLASLYILTFGLAFLETTANPFILSMGSPETAKRRLNLAQAFNPIGSLTGMFVASNVILSNLWSQSPAYKNADGAVDMSNVAPDVMENIRLHDLMIIRNPYVAIGLVVLVMFVVILITKMPKRGNTEEVHPIQSAKRLLANVTYREGVIAQLFYVAAQITCWTFIIQYAGQEAIGMAKADAQRLNIIAMGIFLCSRFISTAMMKYVNPTKLLATFAIGGFVSILGVIFVGGYVGLYCLVATSAFMSLMFPTIYGIALEDVGQDATLGAAGLVMAIIGGAAMPPLQGRIIDLGTVFGMPAENVSFVVPLTCFVVIFFFAYRELKRVAGREATV